MAFVISFFLYFYKIIPSTAVRPGLMNLLATAKSEDGRSPLSKQILSKTADKEISTTVFKSSNVQAGTLLSNQQKRCQKPNGSTFKWYQCLENNWKIFEKENIIGIYLCVSYHTSTGFYFGIKENLEIIFLKKGHNIFKSHFYCCYQSWWW